MADKIGERDGFSAEEREALREMAEAAHAQARADAIERLARGPRMELGDGRAVPIALVVEVRVPKKLLFLEEMPDGGIRLTVSSAWGLDIGRIASVRIEERQGP